MTDIFYLKKKKARDVAASRAPLKIVRITNHIAYSIYSFRKKGKRRGRLFRERGKVMSAVIQKNKPVVLIEEWTDCYLSPRKKTGFVCTLQLPEKFQRFWGLNDIQQMIGYAEAQNKSNMYISLNSFRYGRRQESDLMQIRNIGVDLDIYKVGATIEEAVDELQAMVIDDTLPEPNLFIQSGQGIQLIYGIEGGAAPQMSWLSRYITSQYIAKLAFLGADAATTDPTRVLRFPGTVNQKNQVKATVEIWNPEEYALQELYRYVTPIEETRRSRKRKKRDVVILPPPKGVVDLYSLNTKKKDDLELLVQLRQGDMTGYRNTFLYTYSFTVALIVKSQAATIVFARQINEKFSEPLLKREVDTAAKSAYHDAAAFLKDFAENDYKMLGLPSSLIKPEKSSTIIDKLDITSEEMEHFRVLIDRSIKQRRNAEYQREKRRSKGVKEREEYIAQEKAKTDNKLEELRSLLQSNEGLTNKVLAERLGVSIRRIQQLKKELKG